jgi:hypothetical protein
MKNKTIEQILADVGEDKHENFSTTSFKFKRDLWEFFTNGPNLTFNPSEANVVEYGTHKGQTTRVLSHIFKHVFTVNLPGHFDQAMINNSDCKNITYVPLNLYQSPIDAPFTNEPISVFFIDAVHTFDAVMSDFSRSLNLTLGDDVYFVFDDYGTYNDVFVAVEQLIRVGELEKTMYIGHSPRHNFGGNPPRVLANYEGVICRYIGQ